MDIGAPQIIYIFIVVLGLGVNLAKHGEPRGAYDAGTAIVASILSFGLFWWGGFFH